MSLTQQEYSEEQFYIDGLEYLVGTVKEYQILKDWEII